MALTHSLLIYEHVTDCRLWEWTCKSQWWWKEFWQHGGCSWWWLNARDSEQASWWVYDGSVFSRPQIHRMFSLWWQQCEWLWASEVFWSSSLRRNKNRCLIVASWIYTRAAIRKWIRTTKVIYSHSISCPLIFYEKNFLSFFKASAKIRWALFEFTTYFSYKCLFVLQNWTGFSPQCVDELR